MVYEPFDWYPHQIISCLFDIRIFCSERHSHSFSPSEMLKSQCHSSLCLQSYQVWSVKEKVHYWEKFWRPWLNMRALRSASFTSSCRGGSYCHTSSQNITIRPSWISEKLWERMISRWRREKFHMIEPGWRVSANSRSIRFIPPSYLSIHTLVQGVVTSVLVTSCLR